MTRKISILFFVVAGYLAAQPWAGVIDPARAADWSGVGVPGGIPARTTICATLNPGATGAQIESALNSCPAGQTVYLTAGNYSLNTGITFPKSNVTLRGAGANQTKLKFSQSDSCHGQWSDICMASTDTNWRGGVSNSANWTAGYARGATQITLSSTSNLAVGDPLVLDQLNDTSDGGTIYVCVSGSVKCSDDGSGGGGTGAHRQNRDQTQIVTVTGISGNQVTISPGLYMPNWNSSKSPGAWWASNPITGVGIENMSLDHTNSAIAGLLIFNCTGCYVKGIRSLVPDRNHIAVWTSTRITIRDSYFYGNMDYVSQSYGIEPYPASDLLIENNIFQHITAPVTVNGACSGCVIGYNYSIDHYNELSNTWMSHGIYLHSGGIDNLLIEGNIGTGLYSDVFHGSHHFVTVFRNRFSAYEPGRTAHSQPMAIWPYSRYFNFIGNVLGDTARPHTVYQCIPGGCSGSMDQTIFVLGTGSVNVPNDPITASTAMRWGNYDTVNKAVRWQASEVPSTLSAYRNPVPASQSLAPSFYLPSKPAWFGNVPFPAIGPDVTNGNIANVGGFANKIPAQLCYDSTAKESNGVLAFNAATCYTGTSTPSLNPPSSMSASVR